MELSGDLSVKVAVRIRPLNATEMADDGNQCIRVVNGEPQVRLYIYALKSCISLIFVQ